MKPEDERLFFEHDIATPLTNSHGAAYLLKMGISKEDKNAAEALEILQSNLHTLERMVGWYWRIRELAGTLGEVEPWSAANLAHILSLRIDIEKAGVSPPAEAKLAGRLKIPQEHLAVGLIGAAVTLSSAAEESPIWALEEESGVLVSSYRVVGEEDRLDPARLFRKVYWPSRRALAAWIDPGLPYLATIAKPFGGTLDLAWSEGEWRLECRIPTVP
jgi:hypothetical protein